MRLDGLWIGQVAMAALTNVAFAFAIGSALLDAWLAKEGARALVAPSHPAWLRAQRSLIAAAIVLVLADVGWLVYQAASMSGSGLLDALGVVPTVIAQTHVGRAWCVAFGGAALLLIAALLGRFGALGHALFWLAVIVAAAGKASIGHAADAGTWSAAAGIQTLHVLATGVWGGLVIAGGFGVLPALDSSIARGVLIRVAGQVSKVSLVALGFVVVTGALNAERGLGGALAPLQSSEWGHVLMLKAALVALAVVLGGMNRMSALPRLRRTASTVDAHTFNNVLHLEALVMIGVFIAAAALAHSAPGYLAAG
ncbi:copper resistance protein CopD [Trinickia terrae]|uniref:Copper resistance protein CopD n=1 Tax=Trinickia terrae TaxID=2571161 RepID=A0A4U1I8D1_9BURK|nr:CopD family protein [Trinickia terrae]TKC89706.1 copper resistance protein CopD [Trinickia terrae]